MGKKPWGMLTCLLLTQVAVAFVGRSIGPLAPFVEESFHLSNAQIGLLPAALFIGQSLVSLPSGWMADRWGTRKMLLFLSILLGLSFFLVSIVPWFYLSLFFIAVGGLGYGSMHPTSNRGIINWFPPHISGTAMGIKQMGVTGGSALAGLVLIPLAIATNWRIAVISSTLFLFSMGLLAFVLYRDPPTVKLIDKTKQPKFGHTIRKLIAHKPLVAVSIAAMGLTSAQLSLTTYIVIYISSSLHYPLIIAGSFLAISEIGGSAGRLVWGIFSDRFFRGERAPVLILIASVTALCSLIIASLPPKVNLWILVSLILLFGFCIAGFNGIWMNFAAEAVPREFAGIGSGFSLAIGSLGVVFGPPAFGWIVDKTGKFSAAWTFLSIEMLVVICLLLWAKHEMRNYKNKFFNFNSIQKSVMEEFK
jgi:MFS transporter, ACS family, hexuronate transporter